MAFLNDLANGISSAVQEQAGLAENVPGNLDFKGESFGKLGDFAGEIDRSAQRQYIETGIVRNIRPRASEIIMQEPDITVVVKKRIFSSLSESYRPDLMDDDEKLFIRATKKLFQNKCRQIANYERLSKFDKITSANDGIISDYALPFVFSAVDAALDTPGSTVSNPQRAVLETIRKVKRFSDPQFFTTWNVASEMPFINSTGQGTGTFDLTLVSQISTTNSTQLGGGSATLTIEDPYKLMIVTNEDIEQAISDASNFFKQNSFFKFTEQNLNKTITDLTNQLNTIRLIRGAARIIFSIREETILYKKIRAVIDEEGREIKFTFDGGTFGVNLFSFDNDSVVIDPLSLSGVNGLKNQEISFFKQIVNNLYLTFGLQQTTRSENREYNKKTNYIRKKMNLHYKGKPIIQPMDVVYIFASSKTLQDSKVTQGLNFNFLNNSILNKIDQTVSNIESAFDDIKSTFSGGAGGESGLEQERNAIAGPDFPLWLYGLLRNDFTRQSAGTCIFAGIVDEAPHSYSNGQYTLTVNVKDNSHYFKMGQINIDPSTEVYNGALYDPLTPFELDFDESSGFLRGELPTLLDANIRLLNSRSIRAKLGRNRGSSINEEIYYQPDIEHVNTEQGNTPGRAFGRRFRKKLLDPDGFVYRWKEGIGSLVLYGPPHSPLVSQLGTFKGETSPNITKDAFAGQDVMNVLSLLITGQPYSFNNFIRGAISWGKLQKNDLNNEGLSVSFFKGLISDLTKQNATWGNFIPFKKLIVNERAYDFLASGEFDLVKMNSGLNKLLRERAELFDEITSYAREYGNTPMFYKTKESGLFEKVGSPANTSGLESLTSDLKKLDFNIQQIRKDFAHKLNKTNTQSEDGTLGVFGDDISFDPSITGADDDINETKRLKERQKLRDELNRLTRRRIWKVRGNDDPNLFIVDDTYDKNYDIQAFEKALSSNLKLFNSTYSTVFDQISIVSKFLGLEVFADSQGHIQARPPQYNRMPSSVFAALLQNKAERGIQIFPSYLEKLFFNNVQGLTEHIEIIEDQIRLRAAALGRGKDHQAVDLIGEQFVFLTDKDDGKFSKDIRSLLDHDDPDLQESRHSGALDELSQILRGPLNSKVNFAITKRVSVVNDDTSFRGDAANVDDAIQKISRRLFEKTGQPQPTSVQGVLSNDRAPTLSGRSQVDILKATTEISNFVAERQRLIKSLSNTVKNLRAGASVNKEGSSSARALLLPNISKKSEIPEILAHMIENENVDDLGVGSGNRYVIKDERIISMNITEKAPDYNMVQVDGKLAGGITPVPSGLNVGNGGNGIGTAWAVDYDLWRMYGFRGSQQVTAPFLSNPITQCAPYAVFLLNLARKNIFQGNVTVIGNEFIQAGEVYYLEDRDLLFYAESVTHNFAYNGSYTTSINMKYGHNPGEYIPTHLDIIGKGLYANKHQSELVRHVRHGRVDNSTHITTIVHETGNPVFRGAQAVESLVNSKFGDANRKALGNLMLTTAGILTPTSFGKVAEIELRVYSNSDGQIKLEASNTLKTVAESIRDWIIDPTQLSLDGKSLLPNQGADTPVIDKERVNIVEVDLNPAIEGDGKSPSASAWSLVRDMAAGSEVVETVTARSQVAAEAAASVEDVAAKENSDAILEAAQAVIADVERKALSNTIIDIWVKFVNGESVLEGSKKTDSPTDQASQQVQDAIDNNPPTAPPVDPFQFSDEDPDGLVS